ncbi:hypothetical protein DM02DRAFT_477538, partial [Periconia macrospinosa]
EGRRISKVDAAFTSTSARTEINDYPLKRSFILDSGSTCHITNNPDRIYNFRSPMPGDYI